MTEPQTTASTGGAIDTGLKAGAIGLTSTIVIGVASTAPGESLAASLGLVTESSGAQAPAILWLAFVPMLFIASAYFYLNRADPDCGTTFTWATRALGPIPGWLGGVDDHHRRLAGDAEPGSDHRFLCVPALRCRRRRE